MKAALVVITMGALVSVALGVEFSIINNCPHTIWPGFYGKSLSDPNWGLPLNGGWQLDSGETTTFTVPQDLYASRVWARTNCDWSSGQFRCDTGSCGPDVACAGRTGQTPATLAEITLGSPDFYDVSLVDGYNIQTSIRPTSPSSPNNYWCTNTDCTSDLNDICPDELKKWNQYGQVVGCLSACERFNTDEYCCRGAFNTPSTCKSSSWPVNYPWIFKQACPSAYSYAYDDQTSTFTCQNTDYEIIFC